MKRRSRIISCGIMSAVILLAGCSGDQNTKEELNGQVQQSDSNETMDDKERAKIIETNQKFLMEELNIPETGALGTAQTLVDGGCKIIQSIEDLEDDGNSYAMTLVDESSEKYDITMGHDGYLGTVKDQEGNYLYTPED